ncbi:hypothetical protein DL765_010335 [Monosporascus sp. GIB2]|nr:hypothetical protein DL765_010335 [Monosporascus sp. GIB2]
MTTNNQGGGGPLAPLRTPRLPLATTATTTPNSRRAISAEPSTAGLSLSARLSRNAAATPHAKAAFRSLSQRRATIFTPGRRRSLRDARRETPRDILRNLSRALAPTSTAIESSSSSSSPGSRGGEGNTTLGTLGEIDDDDEFPIERPRFSLPGMEDGDDEDDGSVDLKPPRLSGFEEDNYTALSIELPRRAWSEGPLSRMDRASLGSVRFSDYVGPELPSDDAGIDSGFFPPPAFEDDDDDDMVLDEQAMVERWVPLVPDDIRRGRMLTGDRFDGEDPRRQTVGRESDFGAIEIPDAGNETTFLMAPAESPVRDLTMVEGGEEDEDAAPMEFDEADPDDSATALPGMADDNEGLDQTIFSQRTDLSILPPRRRKTGKKISKHGIEYKSLPQGVVKRLAMTFAKTAGVGKAKISPDTLDAIMQATDWFFEQLADDLQAYAKHAGRKTIDESDMITLMRRQRQTSASTTPFALAQRHLPRELLQELRMPVPAPTKAPRKKARRVEVDDEEDAT